MRELPEPALDKNSRGLGLLLRVAGAVLPLILGPLAAYLAHESRYGAQHRSLVRSVFAVIAFPWAWPYGAYHYFPITFGVVGLITACSFVVLLVRRDRTGAIAVVLWTFFLSWLIGSLLGSGD